MSNAARSAKRAKVAVQVQVPTIAVQVQVPPIAVDVQVLEVADPAAELARLERHLAALYVHDQAPRFSLAFPPGEWAQPSVPVGKTAMAALYFGFGGADSVRNMEGTPDRDPVFINLAETRTIPEPEIREFLRRAATAADAHYRIRKLAELADLRALLGDAVPAPRGAVLWLTTCGLQVEYGRHTQHGHPFQPSPTSTARFSIYAPCVGSAPRVPLTADELAAKCARWAPTTAPATSPSP